MVYRSLADNKASSLKCLGVIFLSRKVPYLLILCTHKTTCILQLQHSLHQNGRTSETRCPTIKRIYIVVDKKSFRTSFEKYRWVTSSVLQFQFQLCIMKREDRFPEWYIANKKDTGLFFSRECGFGDPENLEPCSSSKCLLFSILRPSFHRSDFPGGITTFGLNRLSLYSSLNPVTSFTANLETVKFSSKRKNRFIDAYRCGSWVRNKSSRLAGCSLNTTSKRWFW